MENLNLSNESDKEKWFDYIYDGLEEDIYGRTSEEVQVLASPNKKQEVQEPVGSKPKSFIENLEIESQNGTSKDTSISKSGQDLSLEKLPEVVVAKYSQVEKENEILRRRISELFKTAKVEIERKDRQVSELTRKLDDVLLKRNRPFKEEDKYTNFDRRKRFRSRSPLKTDREHKNSHSQRTKSYHQTTHSHHKNNFESIDNTQYERDRELRPNKNYNSHNHEKLEHTSSFQENQSTLKCEVPQEVVSGSNKTEEPVVKHPNLFSKRMCHREKSNHENREKSNHERQEPKIVRNLLPHSVVNVKESKKLVVKNSEVKTETILSNLGKVLPKDTKNILQIAQKLEQNNKFTFEENKNVNDVCLISKTVDEALRDPRLEKAATTEQKMKDLHPKTENSEPQNYMKKLENYQENRLNVDSCLATAKITVDSCFPTAKIEHKISSMPVARQRSKSVAEEKLNHLEFFVQKRRKSMCENGPLQNTGTDIETKSKHDSFKKESRNSVCDTGEGRKDVNNFSANKTTEIQKKPTTCSSDRQKSTSKDVVNKKDATINVERQNSISENAIIYNKPTQNVEQLPKSDPALLNIIKIPKKSAEKERDSRDILSNLHDEMQGSLRNTMQKEMGEKCNKILKDCEKELQKGKETNRRRSKSRNRSDKRDKSKERDKDSKEKYSEYRGRSKDRETTGEKGHGSKSTSRVDSREYKGQKSKDRGRSRDRAHRDGNYNRRRSKSRHYNDTRHREHISRDKARSTDRKRDDRSRDRRDKSRHKKDDRDKSRHRSKSRERSKFKNKDLEDPNVKNFRSDRSGLRSDFKESRDKEDKKSRDKEDKNKTTLKLSLDEYMNKRIENLKNEETRRGFNSSDRQVDLKDKKRTCGSKSGSRSSSRGSTSNFDLNCKDKIKSQNRIKLDGSKRKDINDKRSRTSITNRKEKNRDNRTHSKLKTSLEVEEMIEKLYESEHDMSSLLTFEDENSIDRVLELYNQDMEIFSDDSNNLSKTTKALADKEPEDLVMIKAKLLAQLTNDDSLEEGEIVEVKVTKDKKVRELTKPKKKKDTMNEGKSPQNRNNKDINEKSELHKIVVNIPESKDNDDESEKKNVKVTKIKDNIGYEENMVSKPTFEDNILGSNKKLTEIKTEEDKIQNKVVKSKSEAKIFEKHEKLWKMEGKDTQEKVMVTIDESRLNQMAGVLEGNSRMELSVSDSKINIISHVVLRSNENDQPPNIKPAKNVTVKEKSFTISLDKSVQIDSRCGNIIESPNEPIYEGKRNHNFTDSQNSSKDFDTSATSLDESNCEKPKKRIRPILLGPAAAKANKKDKKLSKNSLRCLENNDRKNSEDSKASTTRDEESISKKRITPKLIGSLVPVVEDQQISEFQHLLRTAEKVEILNSSSSEMDTNSQNKQTNNKLETEKLQKPKSSSESEIEVKREPRKLPIKKIRPVLETAQEDIYSSQNATKKETNLEISPANQKNCKKNDIVHVRDTITRSENDQLKKLDKKNVQKPRDQITRVTRASREREIAKSDENFETKESEHKKTDIKKSSEKEIKKEKEEMNGKPKSCITAKTEEKKTFRNRRKSCSEKEKEETESTPKSCIIAPNIGEKKTVINRRKNGSEKEKKIKSDKKISEIPECIQDKTERLKQVSGRRKTTETIGATENSLETKFPSRKANILSRVEEQSKKQTEQAETSTENSTGQKSDPHELTIKLVKSRTDSNNYEISTDDEKGLSERVPNPDPVFDEPKSSEVINISLAKNNTVSRGKVMENLKQILGHQLLPMSDSSLSMDDSSASKSPKIIKRNPSRGKIMDLLEKEVMNKQSLIIEEECESLVDETPKVDKQLPSTCKMDDKALQIKEHCDKNNSREDKNVEDVSKAKIVGNNLIDILKNDENARKLPNKHISKGKYMIRIQHSEDSFVKSDSKVSNTSSEENEDIQMHKVTKIQENSMKVASNRKISIGKRIDNHMIETLKKHTDIDKESETHTNNEQPEVHNSSTPLKKYHSESVHNYSMPSMDSNSPIKKTPVKTYGFLPQLRSHSSAKKHSMESKMINIFGEDITLDSPAKLGNEDLAEVPLGHENQSFKEAYLGNPLAQTPLWKQMEISDDSNSEMSELSLSYEKLPEIQNQVEKTFDTSHQIDKECDGKLPTEEKQDSANTEEENKKTFKEILHERLGKKLDDQCPSNTLDIIEKSEDLNPEKISKILSEGIQLKNPLKIKKCSPKKTKPCKRKAKRSPEKISPKRAKNCTQKMSPKKAKSFFPPIKLDIRKSSRSGKKMDKYNFEDEEISSEDENLEKNEKNLEKPSKTSGRKTPVSEEKLDTPKATPKRKKAVVTKKTEQKHAPTPNLNQSTENVDSPPIIRRRNSKSLSPGKGGKNISKSSADSTPISLNKGNLSRRSTSGKNSKRVGGRNVKILDETLEEEKMQPMKIVNDEEKAKKLGSSSPLVHFENMLTAKTALKTNQPTVELTHDGEIPHFPVIHIEENTFVNFQNKSLLNFVDAMNMSTSNFNILSNSNGAEAAKTHEQTNLLTFTNYLNSSNSTTSTPMRISKTQRCITFENGEKRSSASKNSPILSTNSKGNENVEAGGKNSPVSKQNSTNTSSTELQNSSIESQNNETNSSLNISENKTDLDSSAERKRKIMSYTFGVGIKRSRTRRPVVEFVD